MFTFNQIDGLHNQLGKADTLLEYCKALNSLGIIRYDTYVTDGHSEYFGKNEYMVKSPSYHEVFTVAEETDEEAFRKYLRLSERGKLGYVEMSKGLAESGVENG